MCSCRVFEFGFRASIAPASTITTPPRCHTTHHLHSLPDFRGTCPYDEVCLPIEIYFGTAQKDTERVGQDEVLSKMCGVEVKS
jgi:hypothetical protein